MEKIFYKITDQDQIEFNKLERAYFEMYGLQSLLINIINNNVKLIERYEYYIDKYIYSFEKLEKQKYQFTEQVLKPKFNDNFDWVIDFHNKGVNITKYD